jgi:hypothetical protein
LFKVTRSKSKRIVVTQLKPVRASRKKRDCSEVLAKYERPCVETDSRLSILQEQDEDFDSFPPSYNQMNNECDLSHDLDEEVPEMSSSFNSDTCVKERHRLHTMSETLRDKVHLTRFLNAGLMTAMIFGLNKKPRR